MSEFWDDMERQALYTLPIEQLELHANVIKSLHDMGIKTIGDCLDYFESPTSFKSDPKLGSILWMRLIVMPKLKKMGFWKYFENGGEE
jgi:hypothetical protein